MEIKNELGNCIIADKVFKEIATVAVSNIKNVYPAKKDKDLVEVKFSKNDELTINIPIRVKKGIDIVKTCNKIQDEVNENILLMTGKECNKINIDIQGFEIK